MSAARCQKNVPVQQVSDSQGGKKAPRKRVFSSPGIPQEKERRLLLRALDEFCLCCDAEVFDEQALDGSKGVCTSWHASCFVSCRMCFFVAVCSKPLRKLSLVAGERKASRRSPSAAGAAYT
jgi:hypothetical protein